MRHFQRRLSDQVSFRSLATRLFGLMVFVSLTVYSPVHLLLEAHTETGLDAATAQEEPLLCQEEREHSHGGHEQHLASDHQLRATPQQQVSVEQCPVVLLALDGVSTPEPCFLSLFLTERVNPPGGTLSAPILPRAPPVI